MKKIIIVISLLLSFGSPLLAFGANEFTSNLYYGITGNDEVIQLQEFLTDQKLYTGPITGNFYSLTKKAVIAFQKAHSINGTGYFGPLTRAQANQLLGPIVDESGAPVTTSSTPAATTNDVLSTLTQQITQLQAQLAQLQQNQTLSSIQQQQAQQTQVLNQIQQNTVPPPTPPTPPPPPPPDTTPPLFSSGPTPIVTLVPVPSGGDYKFSVTWQANEPATFVSNNCIPQLPAPSNQLPTSVHVDDRQSYVCTLKIKDSANNFSEQPYTFTVGPGFITADSLGIWSGQNVNANLTNGSDVPVYRIRLCNHDNWTYYQEVSLATLTLKLTKSGPSSFAINSLQPAIYAFAVPWPYNSQSPPTQLLPAVQLPPFSNEEEFTFAVPHTQGTNSCHYVEFRANLSGVESGASLTSELLNIGVSAPNDKVVNLLNIPYTITGL